jgi:hypothetical protein
MKKVYAEILVVEDDVYPGDYTVIYPGAYEYGDEIYYADYDALLNSMIPYGAEYAHIGDNANERYYMVRNRDMVWISGIKEYELKEITS